MAILSLLVAMLGLSAAFGKNLIECPDCGKDVSARAISCPHCGCPGEFIAEVARRQEEEKRPKAVVQVKADAAGGFGVAFEEDGAQFVVLPVGATGSAASLSLCALGGAEVPYSQLEMAKEVGLIRFRVKSDSLAYLRRSTVPGDTPATFLGENGLALAARTPPESARPVARLGADGGVMAINAGKHPDERWVALNQPIEWVSVEPSRFREQTGLLARLALRKPSELLADADRGALEKTDWLCREFRERAQKFLNSATSSPRKSK